MLPVGYRFDPTDEELVVYYLKRKVHGLPLPASIIPEYNSNYYLAHPSHLPMPLGNLLSRFCVGLSFHSLGGSVCEFNF